MSKNSVILVANVDIEDISCAEMTDEQAKKLIMAIDVSRQDAGFTEDLIIALIKAMKKEYKGDKQALLDFKNLISGAL